MYFSQNTKLCYFLIIIGQFDKFPICCKKSYCLKFEDVLNSREFQIISEELGTVNIAHTLKLHGRVCEECLLGWRSLVCIKVSLLYHHTLLSSFLNVSEFSVLMKSISVFSTIRVVSRSISKVWMLNRPLY